MLNFSHMCIPFSRPILMGTHSAFPYVKGIKTESVSDILKCKDSVSRRAINLEAVS